jgi:hypothetical protein
MKDFDFRIIQSWDLVKSGNDDGNGNSDAGNSNTNGDNRNGIWNIYYQCSKTIKKRGR